MQKELFFKEVLVPTGQLVELLVFLTHRHEVRTKLDVNLRAPALAHQLWEPLNLAAAYVLTAVPGQIPAVNEAITHLQAALVKALDLGATKAAKEYVASAFKRSHPTTTAPIVSRFITNLKHLRGDLPGLVSGINTAIGYAPAVRDKWLNEVFRQRTPITATSNPSGWRTFVRNSEWSRAAGLLGVSALFTPGFRTQDRFGSRVGQARLAALWSEVFGAVSPTALEASPVLPSAPTLPENVSVRSNMRGWLEVTSKFDPKLRLNLVLRTALSQQTRGRIPAPLKEHLEVRQHQLEVPWPELESAVEKSTDWLALQAASMEEVSQVVSKWLEEKKLEEVRKKLNAHFSEEERALLAVALKSP